MHPYAPQGFWDSAKCDLARGARKQVISIVSGTCRLSIALVDRTRFRRRSILAINRTLLARLHRAGKTGGPVQGHRVVRGRLSGQSRLPSGADGAGSSPGGGAGLRDIEAVSIADQLPVSISVWGTSPDTEMPTVMQKLELVHATPASWLLPTPSSGLRAIDQLVPSNVSIRV